MQAQGLGSDWVLGLPLDAPERLIAQLRGVTAAQVKSVAAKYFGDDQLTVAILRPQPLDKTRKPRVPLPGARH
jgi:zinc protease